MDPDPLVRRRTDPGIRIGIRTKMLRIPNTAALLRRVLLIRIVAVRIRVRRVVILYKEGERCMFSSLACMEPALCVVSVEYLQ